MLCKLWEPMCSIKIPFILRWFRFVANYIDLLPLLWKYTCLGFISPAGLMTLGFVSATIPRQFNDITPTCIGRLRSTTQMDTHVSTCALGLKFLIRLVQGHYINYCFCLPIWCFGDWPMQFNLLFMHGADRSMRSSTGHWKQNSWQPESSWG